MRDIIAGKEAGDEKCTLAYDLYVDRLRKYIAQYFGVMNGADAIVFTAGIGENSADVRASVLDGLTWLVLKWILKRMFSDVLAILQQQIQLLKCLLFQRMKNW